MKPKTERNNLIKAMRKEGKKLREIAKEFKISIGTVRKISMKGGIKMSEANITQYDLLKLKPVLTTREQAVVNMYDEAVVAEKAGVEPAIADTAAALVRAQDDLAASEAGVSEAANAAVQETSLSDAEPIVPEVFPGTEPANFALDADLKAKQDALATLQAANPQDSAAIVVAQAAVDASQASVNAGPVVSVSPSAAPEGIV